MSINISIITISYNALSSIKDTILSVISQTYNNIEFIIIDGGSTDGTIEIINKYQDNITYWISEPDKGIYDAMNKGMKIANGDYIFFLNAGDVFYAKNTLENIVDHVMKANISLGDIIVGDILAVSHNQHMGIISAKKKITPWYTPPHQAMFFPKEIYKQFLYYTGLKILSDRELYLRLSKFNKYHITFVNEIITLYDLSGVSSKPSNALQILKESIILYFLYGNSGVLELIYQIVKMVFKYLISLIIPQKYYNRLLYKIKRPKMK